MNTTGVFTFSAIKGTDVLTPEDFRDGDKFTITATDGQDPRNRRRRNGHDQGQQSADDDADNHRDA